MKYKSAEWNGKKYKISVDKNGNVKCTKDLTALITKMQRTIRHIAIKYAVQSKIEQADLIQLLNLETLKMLAKWNDKRSKWGTYWRGYLLMRCADEIEKTKGGYSLPLEFEANTEWLERDFHKLTPKNIMRMTGVKE